MSHPTSYAGYIEIAAAQHLYDITINVVVAGTAALPSVPNPPIQNNLHVCAIYVIHKICTIPPLPQTSACLCFCIVTNLLISRSCLLTPELHTNTYCLGFGSFYCSLALPSSPCPTPVFLIQIHISLLTGRFELLPQLQQITAIGGITQTYRLITEYYYTRYVF